MMRVDGIKERIAVLSAEEQELAMVIADLNIRKENALASINTELETIAADRAATTQSVAADFLALYEKIREGNSGIGAAVLAGNQCKGCNLTLNTIELQRISALAEDEVVRCEECRCILVRDR
jgi:predicted  nucleic acid-binding Zn-ribbon protein